MSVIDANEHTGNGAEWTATIRGEEVHCRWSAGTFEGHPEVLARLIRFSGGPPSASTLDEARSMVRSVLIEPVESPLSVS
jgi:hypothetical protein